MSSPRNKYKTDDIKVVPLDNNDACDIVVPLDNNDACDEKPSSWKVGWTTDSGKDTKGEHSICTKEMRKSTRRTDIQRLIVEDLDRNGDGTVTMEEMMGFLDRHVSLDKNNKETKKALLATFFLLFLSVILNGIAALGANEASKESHITSGAMLDLDGDPVTVESPESFATLWDLPNFSTRTLADMNHITLALANGAEVTLDIASAMKTPGTASVTFRSTDGSSIMVDGLSRVAVVEWNDESYVVRSLAGRRKLSEVGRPKLLHKNDFFSEANGFAVDAEGNHRRLADSDTQGWASFSLSAGKELLDVMSVRDSVDYDSVYFQAKLHTTAGGHGDVILPVELYFMETADKENGKGSKVRIGDPSGGSYLTDHGLGYGFKFDKTGTLVKCESLGELAEPPAGLTSLALAASDDGLSLVITDDENANLIRIVRASIQFDTSGEKLATPSADDCFALNKVGTEGVVDEIVGQPEDLSLHVHEDGRRKLWAGGSVSDKDLWNAAQTAYKNTAAGGGWTTWATCEASNAYAKFMYKGIVMVLAFAGTDGLTDFGDWANNLNLAVAQTAKGKIHQGFVDYQAKISACIQSKRNLMASQGIDLDYVTGHSLGGAAATVWSQLNNNPSRLGVYSFGAPVTRNDGSCSVPGKRFAHESDAIASNVMGIFGSFNHDINNFQEQYKETYCSSSCGWLGCCPWGWSTRLRNRNKACTTKAGGCSLLVDCAYNFATVHGQYGSYL